MEEIPWYHRILTIGGLSPKSSFTVVNANDKFIQFQPEADEFIKSELGKRGVRVLYNTKLNEINKVSPISQSGLKNCQIYRFEEQPYLRDSLQQFLFIDSEEALPERD